MHEKLETVLFEFVEIALLFFFVLSLTARDNEQDWTVKLFYL